MIIKTVYVLGSGFSAVANLPMMNNFLDKAKDIAEETSDKRLENLLGKIDSLSNIKNHCKIDLFNIEDAFSILMTEDWLKKTRHTEDMRYLIKLVLDKHTPKISNAINENSLGELGIKNLIKKDNPYQKIFCFLSRVMCLRYKKDLDNKNRIIVERFENNEKNDIITLNYDILLENCLDIINRYVAENNKIEFSEKFSELYKLHGSVENNNSIMPPTWAKYKIDPELEKIWLKAFDKISKANEIVFIGYSFPDTDSYFSYFFKLAIHYSKNLKKITVVNPDGNTGNRCKEILGFEKLEFINRKWDSFDFEAAFYNRDSDGWYYSSETLISG